jgi:hypothetical protein
MPMTKSKASPPLVVKLCRALVEAGADRKTGYWINVDRVRAALGIPTEELDAAIACAVARKLVRVNGLPADRLTVTYDGLTLSSRVARASRKRRHHRPVNSA